MIDPIATGPIAKSDGIAGTWMATAIPFFFVLLGDLRVLLLAIGVARPDRPFTRNLTWAIGVTLIVPAIAGPSDWLLRQLVPELHSQALWMIYEASFLGLCVALSRHWLPRMLPTTPQDTPEANTEATRYLRALFGYSAAYYALWLIADCVIVLAELDLGWALRIVPNQLYYAFWVPFAYGRFFSAEAPLVSGNAAR